jgi:predicted transcriptional regulator
MHQSILQMAKDLVMAQIQAGQLPSEDMQNALQQTYVSLMALKAREETGVVSPVQVSEAASGWKKSITKHTVTCLECGATFKQLSRRHLQDHGLDGRSYRAKYGIPRTQPLSAKDTTAIRKKIVQQTKPWEKAPAYQKSKGEKVTVAKKTGRRARRHTAE